MEEHSDSCPFKPPSCSDPAGVVYFEVQTHWVFEILKPIYCLFLFPLQLFSKHLLNPYMDSTVFSKALSEKIKRNRRYSSCLSGQVNNIFKATKIIQVKIIHNWILNLIQRKKRWVGISYGGGKLSAVSKNRLNVSGQEGRTEKAEEARKRASSLSGVSCPVSLEHSSMS